MTPAQGCARSNYFTGHARWLGLALLLFVGSGSDCRQQLLWRTPHVPPAILSHQPTLDEIITTVNANTARVRTLSTQQATLSGTGFPSLRTSLAVETPRKFRLRAAHALSGPEIDLGSGDELFWMWVKRSQPPAMYYCRHQEFAGSAMRRIIPVQPEQVVEAFGLPTLDPQGQHVGPTDLGANRLQIRSTIAGPEGPLTRITIVDSRASWVLEQQLYDRQGQTIATVKTSRHQRDALSGAFLPQSIDMSWPQANLAFTLDVAQYQVNQPLAADMWKKPEEPGYPNVNLADPNLIPVAQGPAAQVPAPPATPSFYQRPQ